MGSDHESTTSWAGHDLVDRRMTPAAASELTSRGGASLPSLTVSGLALGDLELLGSGAYSPLTGFLNHEDYIAVVQHAQLAGGSPWTLPITLPISSDEARTLAPGSVVALREQDQGLLGLLTVSDVFERDLGVEAREVYRTNDPAHPGVAVLMAGSRFAVGGEVATLPTERRDDGLTPAEARAEFARRDWSTVVAFQTRNPVHRAHEYLTKVALEQVDGLFLHPLTGTTKDDDVPVAVRMRCYEALLDNYYPHDRVVMSGFRAGMRYAGPREAVFHGLVRRNFGCTHFIIGRDAAGVGSYYGTYDAQHLYDELGGAARLGFVALKFEHAFFCRACDSMTSTRTCPHGSDDRVVLSGTSLRAMLARGDDVPGEITRPEVAAILRDAYTKTEVVA